MSKFIASLLIVSMLLTMVFITAMDTIPGEDSCNHVCDEDCFATEAVPCEHVCIDDCYSTDESSENVLDCNHDCGDGYGYIAVPNCRHECSEECAITIAKDTVKPDEFVSIFATSVEIGTPSNFNTTGTLTGRTRVYFGNYGGNPIMWHVVATGGGTATLWTTTNMGNRQYDPLNHNNWSGSEIAGWLNGTFLTSAFSTRERAQTVMVQEYGTANEPFGTGSWAGTIDSRQTVVLPSVDEVDDGGTWGLTQTDRATGNLIWWLRSPGDRAGRAALVYSNGDVGSIGNNVGGSGAVRPAFKLDLSSVIFTSAAVGGKSSATVGSGLISAAAPTGAVKFTMQHPSQTLNVLATEAQAVQSGATLTFSYSGATTGSNQFVSAVLEQSGNVTHYGKLANSSAAASGSLSIPLTDVANGTYTLKIFSEEANGDNLTDFASTPITMTLTVTGGTGTVSNFGGTVLSSAKAIISFTLAGTTGTINEAAGTVAVTVPHGTDVTSLTPTIVHTGASISPTGAQNFSSPVTYTVTALDSTTMQYTVTVTVAPPIPTYNVTVVNGTLDSGGISGSFAEGAMVHITANTPPSGEKFKEWQITPAVTFIQGTSATTQDAEFTMPAQAVTATATFEPIPSGEHLITVTHTGNGVANANVQSATPGATITLTATPDSGNIFIRWEIISGGITLSSTTSATATFTMPDSEVTVNAVFLIVFTVLEQTGTWTGSGNAVARIDANPADFIRLLHNNAIVDPSNYTVTAGSTIITKHEDFIKTLPVGTHIFRAEFTTGFAEYTLVINATNENNTPDDNNNQSGLPKTGVDSNIMLLISLLILSAMGAIITAAMIKRVKSKKTR